jgi:hypothetical protein
MDRMDEVAHDERMRRLQRIAYGAVASDAERAAALAELDALRRERERNAAEHEAAEPEAGERVASVAAPDGERGEPSPPSPGPAYSAAAGRSPAAIRFTWAIAVGVAALAIGIAVGWQIGQRHSEPVGDHRLIGDSRDLDLSVNQLMPIPIEAAPAVQVFDREAHPTDTPVGLDRNDLLADSYRLLSTRSDGVRIYAARTLDSANVCVVITLPSVETPSEGVVAGGSGSACTSDGRFPGEGLTIGFSGQGRGAIRATWSVDGSINVSPADPGPAAAGASTATG